MTVLLLLACSSSYEFAKSGSVNDATGSFPPGSLRIDVTPSASSGLLSQSRILLPEDYAEPSTQTLAPTVTVSGQVNGWVTTGWGVDVPTTLAPLDAALQVWRDNALDGGVATASADAGGSYTLSLPAGERYTMSVVPYDGDIAPVWYQTDLDFTTDVPRNFALELGSPLYGRVVDERGQGIGGATLRVHTLDGEIDLPSAPFETDATGWFTTRLQGPGVWGLELVQGSIGGRTLPGLTTEVRIEDESGGQADITVGDTYAPLVEGRVVDHEGQTVEGAQLRLTSRSLDAGGTYTAEVSSQRGGELFVKALAGDYLLEVFPAAGSVATPVASLVRVPGAGLNLGTVTLQAPVTLRGVVEDAHGRPVAKAQVSAQQLGFGGYVFDAETDGAGRFALEAPDTNYTLTISPAAATTSGAIGEFSRAAASETQTYALPEGTLVERDLVDPDGAVLAFALVEIRSANEGRLLGRGLTNDEGYVALAVALPDGDDTGTTSDPDDTGAEDTGDTGR